MHHQDKAVELPSLRRAALPDNMALDIAVLPGMAVVEVAVAEVEGVVADQVLVAPFFKLSYLLSCQFTSCGGEESSFLDTPISMLLRKKGRTEQNRFTTYHCDQQFMISLVTGHTTEITARNWIQVMTQHFENGPNESSFSTSLSVLSVVPTHGRSDKQHKSSLNCATMHGN